MAIGAALGRKREKKDTDPHKEFEENMSPRKDDPLLPEKNKKKKKARKKSKLLLVLIAFIVLAVAFLVAVRFGVLEKFGIEVPPALRAVTDMLQADPAQTDPIQTDPSQTIGTQGDIMPSGTTVQPEAPTINQTTNTQGSGSQITDPAGTFQEMRAALSEDKLTELKKVGIIYSKMDPAAAADIMLEIYQPMELATIIYYMQPAAAASLLAEMDSAQAARVTQILMT